MTADHGAPDGLRERLYVALVEQRVIDSQKYGEAPYAPITWDDVDRNLLAAHSEPGEAASVVVEWGVRYADGQVEGIRRRRTAEDRLATLHHNAYLPGISEWGAAQRDAALVRRTRIVTPDRVTDWEEVDE